MQSTHMQRGIRRRKVCVGYEEDDVLGELVYELSLATSRPFHCLPRNLSRASAAVEALGSAMEKLAPHQLKQLQFTMSPFLYLLSLAVKTTFHSIEPVSISSASSIGHLLASRTCMTRFLAENGLQIVTGICEAIFSSPITLKLLSSAHSPTRLIIEKCSIIFREISRYHPQEVVDAKALRFCVAILREGDAHLKTISAATMAILSTQQTICKLLFSYGAIKPLLLACDVGVTNEACVLSSIGAITQMSRIPEIAVMIMKQGALSVLTSALEMKGSIANEVIHEKALFGLSCFSKVKELKPLLATDRILACLREELELGTEAAKYTVIHVLLDLHSSYDNEKEFMATIVDSVINMLQRGTWYARNICIKAISVLYKNAPDICWYLVDKGNALGCIFDVMAGKKDELIEACLVGLLTLCTHKDVPFLFIEQHDGITTIAPLLGSDEAIVKDLAIVLLKGIALYDRAAVERAVDPTHLQYFESYARDEYDPEVHRFTSGYMIDEFLMHMVENRRDQQYLRHMFPSYKELVLKLNVSEEELVSYEHLFYELDGECRGDLQLTELKMLGVMLGEKFVITLIISCDHVKW